MTTQFDKVSRIMEGLIPSKYIRDAFLWKLKLILWLQGAIQSRYL